MGAGGPKFNGEQTSLVNMMSWACQVTLYLLTNMHGQKRDFWDTLLAAYGRKRQEVAVEVCIPLRLFCAKNCHVLNVIHLKCFEIELPCFEWDTFEMNKYSHRK